MNSGENKSNKLKTSIRGETLGEQINNEGRTSSLKDISGYFENE